ncbi:MAG: CTP synthetase [Candidatus Portnoybacteria bacterium CG23_combo_of_CG06-09_8_20_14_all_37_13]|uniref:CTP synthase n=1 Tax=Candidatus Portnoybacteria bacterium CG23_combo_of_CG06-09_8_20_14_all_37_13 TaxID=1974819 RepID=A0A2G9YCN6_9BACT|nr:MAG: CTP synthetase [Candidatus Portnoybacteria bacterium CG23_combo_of_CG06-09_8_20_14_all_37_13]
MPKYIFVVGGVMSGVGKGTATAAIGKLLQARGFEVTAIKIDPYINVDAGTMNPIEHGEVFVTEDGMETDQDIGNYERFLDRNILSDNYMTTGSIYQAVIGRERNLEYQGKCVQVVPHIPEEVIARIKKVSRKTKADFVLIEIGGTVGEYENLLFLEAGRMMHLQKPEDVIFVMVSYLPIPSKIGEMKTKPTQHAVRNLNSAGIQPDFILARASKPLDEPRRNKISIFCNIAKENVVSAPDVDYIYEIPINFAAEELDLKILRQFKMRSIKKDLQDWKKLVQIIHNPEESVKIGIIGKYFKTGAFTLTDSYISVIEAIKHACWFFKTKAQIIWVDSEVETSRDLSLLDGIIVPGGFGSRGIEGKIKAIQYARENKKPFLGLCFGMQLACIEFARHVCGLKDAHSTEISPKTKNPVIDILAEQKEIINKKNYGGTMRLGAYICQLQKNTLSFSAYKKINITERHRHRYEFNNNYRERLEKQGLIFAGINPEKNLVEIIELKNHPFFVATQFHPEFKSRPLKPHPLFREFIRACLK